MRIITINDAVEPVDYTELLEEIISTLNNIERNTTGIQSAVAYIFALGIVCVVFFALYRFLRSIFRDI